MFNITVRS